MKTRVEINLKNIGHNAKVITNTFKDYKYFIAVLKSNAYGHGMEIVNEVVENGFNYIAVSKIDEAIELRQYNKKVPVLLFEPIEIDELSMAKKYNLTIVVNSIEYLEKLLNEDYKLKIHIQLDTGMNRLGFKDKNEVKNAVEKINKSNYELEGIYSHFSTIGLFDNIYDKQVSTFRELTSLIDIEKIPMVHFSSSVIALTHDKLDICNTLRTGILLYGYNVCPFLSNVGLKNKLRNLRNTYYQKKYNLSKIKTNIAIDVVPAMKLLTGIHQIKLVKKGETIGYGAKPVTEDTLIAILPIGYSNGIGTNSRYVLINENKYYSIGAIGMNMMTIKVDDKVNIDDEVILLGNELTLGRVSSFNNQSLSKTLLDIGNNNIRVYKED